MTSWSRRLTSGSMDALEAVSAPRFAAASEGSESPRRSCGSRAFPRTSGQLLMHVHELLGDIPFGTVVLVMQDGKVIQIETSEKIRLR